MDNLTRKLCVEVAKTVLRVLGEPETQGSYLPIGKSTDPKPATFARPVLPATAQPEAKAPLASGDKPSGKKGVTYTPPTAPLPDLNPKRSATYAPVVPPSTFNVKRGDFVRFWDGHRYSIGCVQSFCRANGKDAGKAIVRVERATSDGGKRGKTYKIEAAKLLVVREGASTTPQGTVLQ